MYKYCEFYCQYNVELLGDNFEVFRKKFSEVYEIDLYEIMLTPSLAYKVLEEKVLSKNSKIKCYSGKVNDFIRKAFYGC